MHYVVSFKLFGDPSTFDFAQCYLTMSRLLIGTSRREDVSPLLSLPGVCVPCVTFGDLSVSGDRPNEHSFDFCLFPNRSSASPCNGKCIFYYHLVLKMSCPISNCKKLYHSLTYFKPLHAAYPTNSFTYLWMIVPR